MKKTLLLSIVSVLIALLGFAQAPQQFNYQGVARDNLGNVLDNQAIGLQLSIRSGSPNGTVEYSETHAATTNQFGLFNVAVGGGTVVSGDMATTAWGNNTHFLQVEMDPTGGTAYVDMGTSQLLSVPYALYAESSGTPGATGPTGHRVQMARVEPQDLPVRQALQVRPGQAVRMAPQDPPVRPDRPGPWGLPGRQGPQA